MQFESFLTLFTINFIYMQSIDAKMFIWNSRSIIFSNKKIMWLMKRRRQTLTFGIDINWCFLFRFYKMPQTCQTAFYLIWFLIRPNRDREIPSKNQVRHIICAHWLTYTNKCAYRLKAKNVFFRLRLMTKQCIDYDRLIRKSTCFSFLSNEKNYLKKMFVFYWRNWNVILLLGWIKLLTRTLNAAC